MTNPDEEDINPQNYSGYTDIGVSMRQEVIEHKKNDGCLANGSHCYWTLPKGVPENIGTGSRLWVASEGRWIGYFIIFEVDDFAFADGDEGAGELRFWSESWHEVYGGIRAPFQGFTYKVPK